MTVVRNEAARRPRLLASLEEFRARGGDMLILDTGSTDGTAEVAGKAGCRVVVEPRRFHRRLTQAEARRINALGRGEEGPFVEAGLRLFHFGRARAHAASLARNDFQLAVDGSDVVDVLNIDALNTVVRSRRAAVFHFETRILGRTAWMSELRDYFYDRRRSAWRGMSHNHLTTKIKASPTACRLDRNLLAVSHHTDVEKKRDFVLAGTALDALADPDSTRWNYFLARALTARGYPHSALDIIRRLDREPTPPATRSTALCMGALCVSRTGGSEDEISGLLFQAALRDSKRRDPLLRIAQRCSAMGDMQGAACFAAAALAIPPRVGVSEAESNFFDGPHALLYWALLFLGREEEARVHFEACRRLDPANPVYADHARLFLPDPHRGVPQS